MSDTITVYKETNEWEGMGEFKPAALDFSNMDVWINMVTLEFRNVISRYETSMDNDGKIDMIEKNLIVKELDEFLNCLIALRFHLLGTEDSYSVDNKKFGFSYTIKESLNGWQGQGAFSKRYKVQLDKFGAWYEKVMLKKFNLLSATYKKSYADGFIDGGEQRVLFGIIDVFVFDILIVRNYIYKGVWTG